MNIAEIFIAYFGIKETQFHRTLVCEEDNNNVVTKDTINKPAMVNSCQ